MYCPQRQYFLEFVHHHINMRNNFQRPRCNSYSNFYNPSWPEHQNHMWVGSHQPVEQPHAPVKADWEIAIDKLADATRIGIEQSNQNLQKIQQTMNQNMQNMQASITNLERQFGQLMHQWDEHEEDEFPCQQIDVPQDSEEWCVIQTPQYAESYDNMLENTKIEEPIARDSCPKDGTTHADPRILPDPLATQVHVPPKSFPQILQEDMNLIVLGEVHTNSRSNMSHDQLSNTLTDSDTGQVPTETAFAAELNTPAVKPIKSKENRGKSYKQAKIYNEKKTFCGTQIPRQEIRPVQKLWVSNTRFKSVQVKHKPCWKGLYLVSKTNSHKRVDKKDSTNEFNCTVQVIPYLPLLYDAVKAWLTLKEQVT